VTTPLKERGPTAPALPPVQFGRWIWRQLTSMRTALLLLLLLALAAIPGSFIPQADVDAQAVLAFADEHPTLTPVLDALGMFDVYASAWFSAIYLLLMISLVGCIVPRTIVYARAVRARPPRAPRTFGRLPASAEFETDQDPAVVLERARRALRRRRYRVDVDAASDDGPVPHLGVVRAERGYLREAGNLVFHVSLVVALVSIAVGSLWGYKGSAIVVEGEGFSNTLTQYDEFSAGAMFEPGDLPPFSMQVDPIDVSFWLDGPQTGSPRLFRARGRVVEEPGAEPEAFDIRVNHPLQVDGASVFLVGQGYAPVVTVRDSSGEVVHSGAVPFLPEDPTYTSNGVIKVPDAEPQLGFEGFFVPSPRLLDDGTIVSSSPTAVLPTLALFAYEGDLGLDDGSPQSVYALDKEGLDRVADDSGEPVRFDLLMGETYELPDGLGSITFDGVRNFGRFQIAHAPMKGFTLAAAVAALLGLITSLFWRPRRAWVRVRRSAGRTVVEVARLDRVSGADLGADVDDLVAAVRGDTVREEPR
jgi:cytochrome c biogenesis protein